MSLGIGHVDGYVLVEEQHNRKDVSVEGSGMEEIEALVVGQEGIGAVLEEQVDDVGMAFLRGPEDGGCHCVAAFGVDVGAGLDEEMAECIMVVDCGPLHRSVYSSCS